MKKDFNYHYPLSIIHYYVIRQSEHLEKFNRVFVDIGKNNRRAFVGCRVNHAEQNRNADAVDNFGFGKIDDDGFTARVELAFAFALDFFAAQFVQIIGGKNGCRFARSFDGNCRFCIHGCFGSLSSDGFRTRNLK